MAACRQESEASPGSQTTFLQEATYHNPKTNKSLRGAMPKLRIQGLERELDAEPGTDVRKACIRSHVNLFWSPLARVFNCRGLGLCGACPVRVLESDGKLPARTKHEKKRLVDKPEDWRLACQLEVRSDLVLEPFPRVPVEEVVGDEALRRAGLTDEERDRLLEKERKERLEARRRVVQEALADRKKRRSKIVGFFAKRLGKLKGKEGEKGEDPKKEKRGKKEKKKDKKEKKEKQEGSGGLAGRFKRKEKGEGGEKEGKGAEEDATKGEEPKKKGFKIGKGEGKGKKKGKDKGKKKEEAATQSGGKAGGKEQ